MSTWVSTITNEGVSLLAMMIDGASLEITRAVSGSSSVPIIDLKEQTQINDIEQTLTLQALRYKEDGTIVIPVLLENTTLEKSYYLWQVGFYAKHPDKGEILFAIAQGSSKKEIPDFENSPGYSIEWNFHFKNSNDSEVVINLDPAGFVTVSAVNDLIDLHSDLSVTEVVATIVGEPPEVEPVTLGVIQAGDTKNDKTMKRLEADMEQKVDYVILDEKKIDIVVTEESIPIEERIHRTFYLKVTDSQAINTIEDIKVSPYMGLKLN